MSGDTERLADSIAGCLSNVSNLPEWMQAPALGRDTRPLLLLAAEAVLASDWLRDHDAELTATVRRQTLTEAADAWDEGYRAAYLFERGEVYPEPENPLRARAEVGPAND